MLWDKEDGSFDDLWCLCTKHTHVLVTAHYFVGNETSIVGLAENCKLKVGWVHSFSENGRLGWLFQLNKENHSHLETHKMLLTWHYSLFPVTLLISLYFFSHTFFWPSTNFFIYVNLLQFNLTLSAHVTFSFLPQLHVLGQWEAISATRPFFSPGEVRIGCWGARLYRGHIQMPTEHNTLNLISLPMTKRKLLFIPTSAKYTIKNLANIPMVQTGEGSNESWWLSWDNFTIWICILNTCMITRMVLKESGVYSSVLPLLKLVPSFTLEMRQENI